MANYNKTTNYNKNRQHHRRDKDEKRGSRVEVRNNDVNRAMRTLKKILTSEGVFKELRNRRFFEKPSMKRKKAKAAARKRWQKELSRPED